MDRSKRKRGGGQGAKGCETLLKVQLIEGMGRKK